MQEYLLQQVHRASHRNDQNFARLTTRLGSGILSFALCG
jgi:hypothetical protein